MFPSKRDLERPRRSSTTQLGTHDKKEQETRDDASKVCTKDSSNVSNVEIESISSHGTPGQPTIMKLETESIDSTTRAADTAAPTASSHTSGDTDSSLLKVQTNNESAGCGNAAKTSVLQENATEEEDAFDWVWNKAFGEEKWCTSKLPCIHLFSAPELQEERQKDPDNDAAKSFLLSEDKKPSALATMSLQYPRNLETDELPTRPALVTTPQENDNKEAVVPKGFGGTVDELIGGVKNSVHATANLIKVAEDAIFYEIPEDDTSSKGSSAPGDLSFVRQGDQSAKDTNEEFLPERFKNNYRIAKDDTSSTLSITDLSAEYAYDELKRFNNRFRIAKDSNHKWGGRSFGSMDEQSAEYAYDDSSSELVNDRYAYRGVEEYYSKSRQG